MTRLGHMAQSDTEYCCLASILYILCQTLQRTALDKVRVGTYALKDFGCWGNRMRRELLGHHWCVNSVPNRITITLNNVVTRNCCSL